MDNQTAPLVNTVRVNENGPLEFCAVLLIAGQDEGTTVALCRCGQSARKPFCDGSHATTGFVSTGEFPDKAAPALQQRDGPLVIQPKTNGCLHVKGNLELLSCSGKTIDRVTECWLCRCGHSKNKPYCDGTHKTIGFRSEA